MSGRGGLREAARTIALAIVMLLGVAPGLLEPVRASDALAVLKDASSWAYQLQDARAAELSGTAYDVVVIDAFFGGGAQGVAGLKRKPLGGRRIVLSYLSIGEAEVYRYYWQRCCREREKPVWLGAENPRWKGNFKVRFWHADWKALIYEAADSYLQRIVALGFDGVYLDRIDVFAELSVPGIDARAQMIAFVRALSEKAKALKPDFLVVAQNAEDLLPDPAYLAAIDAIAKEDLLYGVTGEGRRNAADMIEASTGYLKRAVAAGKPVLAVEYLQEPKAIAAARTELQELGFVPYFAPRLLGRLQVENLEHDDSH